MAVKKTSAKDVTFEFERDTKNMVRFNERGERPHTIGKLYVRKEAHEAIGSPQVLVVTLRPGR